MVTAVPADKQASHDARFSSFFHNLTYTQLVVLLVGNQTLAFRQTLPPLYPPTSRRALIIWVFIVILLFVCRRAPATVQLYLKAVPAEKQAKPSYDRFCPLLPRLSDHQAPQHALPPSPPAPQDQRSPTLPTPSPLRTAPTLHLPFPLPPPSSGELGSLPRRYLRASPHLAHWRRLQAHKRSTGKPCHAELP